MDNSNTEDIEPLWYKNYKRYNTQEDVLSDENLINFKKGKLAYFSYIHLKESKLRRIPNSFRKRFRRFLNLQTGETIGLMNVHCPNAMLNLLNTISIRISQALSLEKPYPYLVTSILRTVEHQNHLKKIGYPAVDNSSHCCGYAADIELRWLLNNKPDVAEILLSILHLYYEKRIINFVQYDIFIHICLNPIYIKIFESEESKLCVDL
ncbi:DUF5715 family protein [Candidatus Haliotispira prima]|uniref:DUF5715 family protein n=1 Tax=Candidatus Haliotispira prima TaxID=3034016 RepID=A0ABY8MEI8_9SPIO|nr:DUF5715 family protein [Candidatus Haliotispira prima]